MAEVWGFGFVAANIFSRSSTVVIQPSKLLFASDI